MDDKFFAQIEKALLLVDEVYELHKNIRHRTVFNKFQRNASFAQNKSYPVVEFKKNNSYLAGVVMGAPQAGEVRITDTGHKKIAIAMRNAGILRASRKDALSVNYEVLNRLESVFSNEGNKEFLSFEVEVFKESKSMPRFKRSKLKKR